MGSHLRIFTVLASSRSTVKALAFAPSFNNTAHAATSKFAIGQQIRHANFIARPRRPYVFTQLVQLSDGSAYTMRTTSPAAIYRPAKDTRNALMWQPSNRSLRNVELDEAGKLAAFRQRFGYSFDALGVGGDKDGPEGATENFSELFSQYATHDSSAFKEPTEAPAKKKK